MQSEFYADGILKELRRLSRQLEKFGEGQWALQVSCTGCEVNNNCPLNDQNTKTLTHNKMETE